MLIRWLNRNLNEEVAIMAKPQENVFGKSRRIRNKEAIFVVGDRIFTVRSSSILGSGRRLEFVLGAAAAAGTRFENAGLDE